MPIPSAQDRLTTQMNDAITEGVNDAAGEMGQIMASLREDLRAAFRQYQRNADTNAGMSTEHHLYCIASAHPLGIEHCIPQCPRRILVNAILRLGGGDITAYNDRTCEESQ